jgi:glutathione S-transferase
MLTLYHIEYCPFCIKVRTVADSLGITLNLIEAERGSIARETVIALGGKSMVPFLVDSNITPSVMMYESDDIIAYLKQEYSL